MKQEDKDLLLKELCVRLPYGIKCHIGENKPYTLSSVSDDYDGTIVRFKEQKNGFNMEVYLSECKPYLFPISSMTDEQKEDLLLTVVGKEGLKLFSVTKDGIISNDKAEQTFEKFSINSINFSNKNIEVYIDWFNKNHFDYRGFIEKGLAIDCTNLNIY